MNNYRRSLAASPSVSSTIVCVRGVGVGSRLGGRLGGRLPAFPATISITGPPLKNLLASTCRQASVAPFVAGFLRNAPNSGRKRKEKVIKSGKLGKWGPV